MSLFRRKPPAAPSTPARAPRAHLEGAGRLALCGWAVAADGSEGLLTLWINHRPVPVEVRRIDRPDVRAQTALVVSPQARPGFEIELDAATWQALAPLGGVVDVELRLDDHTIARLPWGLTDDDLTAWARELLAAAPDEPGQVASWQRLAGFLRPGGKTAPAWAWVDEAWGRQGGEPGVRADGRVEHVAGARITGWACDPNGRPEQFSITCAGAQWPVTAARFERHDVAQAVPGAQRLAGFTIALPPALWAQLPETGAALQLLVNERPLLVPPHHLTRADLAGWLAEAETAARSDLPEQAREAAQDLAWLRAHARAAGVGGLSDSDLHPAAPAEEVVALWALQRAFNDALAVPGATAVSAWRALRDATLASAPVAAQHRFALSLVPAFCAEDALSVLRADLDEDSLAVLAHADGAWELSLLLPVVVLDELAERAQGRLTTGTALLLRIARALPAGWLNTESLRDAVRRVRRVAAEQPLDDAELQAFIGAVLSVAEGVGTDVWSRSHDRHLVATMAELCVLAEGVDEALAVEVRRQALRCYAFVPAFWAAWRALQAPPTAIEALSEAAQQWRRCAATLARSPGELAPWAQAWALLRRFEPWACDDLPSLRRHLLAIAPPGDPVALGLDLAELGAADALRRWPGGPHAVAGWAEMLAAPTAPLAAVRLRLARAESRWHAALRAADLPALRALSDTTAPDVLALSRLGSGFIGLWHLLRWTEARADVPLPDDVREALNHRLAVGVEQALAVIERRRHEIPAPPPVLIAVADAWRLGAAGGEADRAAQILDRLSTAWPAWAQALAAWQAPAEAPGCAAVVPGASPLVVVRQRQADGEALRRIALGWGDALVRRGVAWCVWRPPGVAPASTVHWHGFEAENLLQALAWLLAHSRCGRFVFVDDDVELDVDAWLAGSGPAHHLHGLVSPGEGGASLAVGLGLGLSRAAARSACQLAETRRGAAARLRLGDGVALVSELLGWLGIAPSDEGHAVHLRRVPSAEGVAEGPALFHNAWPPGRAVATVLAAGPTVEGDDAPFGLRRIWPPDRPPRLPGGAVPAQQLVRLSPDGRADDAAPEPCVIAVARNERVLLPHFLAHYRALGVRRFIVADNLSTDGSREYLLSQPDVCVYSVDTAYRDSHYGVAWQLAMLTEHAQRGWALVADIDEFLTWPGCEREGLAALCDRLDAAGHDAATALMVDMYPQGALEEADFERTPPFEAAPFFDAKPVLPWRLGSGSYSQGGTWVSAVRHRLIPHSPPNHYTAQKLPLLRYHAGVRLSEGLHYACGLNPAPQPVFLAHFKYHRGFRAKVEEEIARKQHFNGAEEYRKYRELWAEARGIMFDTRLSQRYENSHSFSNIAWI